MEEEDNHGLDIKLLERFLKKRFHDEKPTDVISVEVKNAVPKGENYVSMIYRVKMICLTAAGKRKRFSTIVKTELKGEETKEMLKGLRVFYTETKIYTTILPIMEELMEEFDDKREYLWPDLLGFQPYSLIAFEDLSDKEYVVADRKKCLDFNHSKLVLRNLARFHAMSKVLLSRGLITSDNGKPIYASDDPAMQKWWDVMITVTADAMKNKWGQEWLEISSKLRNQLGNVGTKLCPLTEVFDQRYQVLNHGDVWICNMLFKYLEEEDNFPISVKFIDYQGSNVNSFIWDITQFLVSSTIPAVRRSRLDELLGAYQLALETNLKTFNYTGYVPTLEDVQSEWKRIEYCQLCFVIAQPVVTAETANAFDMEKLNTHPPHEVVDESILTDGKAIRNVGEDYKMFALSGII